MYVVSFIVLWDKISSSFFIIFLVSLREIYDIKENTKERQYHLPLDVDYLIL